MNRTTGKGKEKGMLFSLDFSVSFILMLVMLLVFALFVFSFQSRLAGELSEYREKRDRALFLDSIIKRASDGNQPGIALFDATKRRILENRVGTLSIGKSTLLEEFGLIGLWIECGIGSHTIYQRESKKGECEVLSRMVFFGKEKCLLSAKFCGE